MKYILMIFTLLFSTVTNSADFSVIRQYVVPIFINIVNTHFKPTKTIKREVITVGSGSGVKIQQGYVLTAGHVAVNPKHKDTILLIPAGGNKLLQAKIVKYDEKKDLALLSISKMTCPCAHISHVNPSVDDLVYAVGYPLYESLQTQILTSGYIQQPTVDGLLTSTSQITFGNSGGGLFGDKSTDYALLGITDAVFTNSMPGHKNTEVEHDWINFSVSATDIIDFLKGTPAEIVTGTIQPVELN